MDSVWGEIAAKYPLFTPAHDIYNSSDAVRTLVLCDGIGFKPFPGARVMDIGANAGIWTAFQSLYGSEVIAYEADPVTFNDLRKMVERTGLKAEIRNEAIWTYDGEMKFIGNPYDGGRNGALQIVGAGPWGDGKDHTYFGNTGKSDPIGHTVKCTSLKTALDSEEWDMVKVDIEGAEYQVISETPVDSLRQIKNIHIEFHQGWANEGIYRRMIEKVNAVWEVEGSVAQEPEMKGRYNWLKGVRRAR